MDNALRHAALVDLQPSAAHCGRALARAQNFSVERLPGAAGATFEFASSAEIILLLPSRGALLSGSAHARLPGHCVAILPAGTYVLVTQEACDVYVLATDRPDIDQSVLALNAEQYRTADDRVRCVGRRFQRVADHGKVRVHPISDIVIPPDNGRLRFLQSETMSLNWVEYDGMRDRTALSPHAHDDLEQASLAIEGTFIHHLRTPWGRNADHWRDDQHLAAGPASIMIIPPEIVHTTEGSSSGRHVLVDIFAPPREDFIARRWVFNADDYAAVEQAST